MGSVFMLQTTSQVSSRPVSAVHSLGRIDRLPIGVDAQLLTHYPAMKLGMEPAIAVYAKKLTPMARELILNSTSTREWVVTAPPFNVLPAAANLLSWRVFENLASDPELKQRVFLLDLKIPRDRVAINSKQDFKTYFEYSSHSIERRIQERQRMHGSAEYITGQHKALRDRGVIVINDIKVTGTQQRFMQDAFNQVKPNCVHWLYILALEEQLGSDHPEIEHTINSSSINSLEDFYEVLDAEHVHYTARCVSRLFALDLTEFSDLVSKLCPDKRTKLIDLARQEGRYDGALFADKMRYLESLGAGIGDKFAAQ